MRTDLEIVVADCFANYLKSVVSGETQAACPVVTWTDPMSIDEADRIIVDVPSCSGSTEIKGNDDCTIHIGVKTQWAQATITEDRDRHFARVGEVRNALSVKSLAEELQPFSDVVGINFVQPGWAQSSKVVEGFFHSETQITVNTFTVQ